MINTNVVSVNTVGSALNFKSVNLD
jgi:hypothetical protein